MKNSINTIKIKRNLSYVLLAVVMGLVSCSSKDEVENIVDENAPVESMDNTYNLTASQFSSGNMQLAKLELHDFHQSVKTNGMFDVPPQNKASVSAYFGGYVKEVDLLPGEKVKKGQILFTLENPDYIQIQQDFLEAKGQLSYLKSDYERQKNLVEDNVTSQKNYLKAEAEYTVTRVRFESLKKKLTLININPDHLKVEKMHTAIAVVSPINGYVTSVNINKGLYLNPGDVAITIIDTDHLHLELTIFEKDLATVVIGQPIKFKIQNNANIEYDARVHLVNKSVDMQKRTVAVHGHLVDEKDIQQFSPGMYVEAEIYTSSISSPSLPQEAIVNVEDKYYVLIQKESNTDMLTFERRQVQIGKSTDGYIEILNHEELQKDAFFLSKGAFNLINE
jgi:membrane fusion protein, heavy metal efflux system